jgi:hypothetical protein
MCAAGGACSSFAPGHAVHLIQARLVSATAAEWVDAIVESADPDGTIVLRRFADDERFAVWNGAGAVDVVAAGTPVAYHPRYHALGADGRLFNTAPVD